MIYITPDWLAELWTGGGLSGVRTAATVVGAGYDDFADLWAPFEAGVGPAGAHLLTLPAERREALRLEMRRRLGVGDAPFRLSARAWLVVGSVP